MEDVGDFVVLKAAFFSSSCVRKSFKYMSFLFLFLTRMVKTSFVLLIFSLGGKRGEKVCEGVKGMWLV